MGTQLAGCAILAWLAFDFVVLPVGAAAIRKLRGQS